MTTTALVPIQDMERMAVAIAKSNLFGMKTQEQVLALMLIAQAEGRHPAIVARDYDIIQNRPAKKAEAMLRDFLDAGGKVEWHQLDDTCADATFSHSQGGSARISWDLARAKKAGISGKDNYQKYPRQMLRSRTVSEGCRTVYPAATSGMYEPGEVRSIVREDRQATHETKDMGKAEVITGDANEGDLSECLPLTTDQPAPPQPATPSGESSQPLVEQAAGADLLTITPEQVSELTEMIMEAGMAKSKVLKQAGVDSLALFTQADYLELRAVLQRKIGAKVGE